MNPYESGAVIDMNAAHKTAPTDANHIVALALEHGFKLKPQVDGRMALNDYVIDFARAVYDIGHAAAKAETAWIPVAVLPAPCLKVIATYVNRLGNRRTIMAKWVPGKTEEAHSLDDEFGEYDEATDTTYVPEGWYECINNLDDYTFVAVSEGVITHWMPLPKAPDAIRAGAKEPVDG